MRDRSETIYADNQEQFIEMMEMIDRKNDRRKRLKRNKTPDDFEEIEKLDYSQELQESFHSYKPTIEEKQLIDEKELLKTIDNMNRNYQIIFNQSKNKENYDPNDLDGKEFSMCFESQFEGNININKFSPGIKFIDGSRDSLSLNISPMISKLSTGPNTLSLENSDFSNMEVFLNQNLINFDDIIKIILIGDKGVGKSLYVNRFTSDSNDERGIDLSKYTPTESLEIKKTFLHVQDKNIKIELWDTNLSVLNSPIIKTYFKISNGFILIADYDRAESINFLEKQIENIINYSNYHNNILLILNRKKNSNKKGIPSVEEKLRSIYDKYNISGVVLDLSKLNRKESSIKIFIQKILHKKLGEKIKDKTLSSFSKTNLAVVKTISKSPKRKRTSNSNQNSNKNSPFLLSKEPQSLSITQKRTHSVKRNLSEILSKLTLVDGSQH